MSMLANGINGKYHPNQDTSQERGSGASQRKKQGTEAHVAAPTKTEVHGWSAACSLCQCPEQMVRSKCSAAPKPVGPVSPGCLPHGPDIAFWKRARCCVRACLGSPMPSVLFDAGSAPQDRQSPKRCIGIEHRFGGRAGLLNIMSSIADQSHDLHMCHDDETQSRAQSDRQVPIVVARCHLLPTFLTSETPKPRLVYRAAMENVFLFLCWAKSFADGH